MSDDLYKINLNYSPNLTNIYGNVMKASIQRVFDYQFFYNNFCLLKNYDFDIKKVSNLKILFSKGSYTLLLILEEKRILEKTDKEEENLSTDNENSQENLSEDEKEEKLKNNDLELKDVD